MFQIKFKKTEKGFTLIEMVVALAIFTVVALIAVGALLKMMDANRKALTLKTAINNINFTLESMSREMRVGKTYLCTNNITSTTINAGYAATPCSIESGGNWLVAFTASNSTPSCQYIYAYLYDSVAQTMKKARSSTCNANITAPGSFEELISPDVKITGSAMTVVVSNQPYASFTFTGSVGAKEKDRTEFSVRTRVSQRIR